MLQHGQGNTSGRTTGSQQGRGCSLGSTPLHHDARCVGGISLREEARSRASPIVWIRRFSLGPGEPRTQSQPRLARGFGTAPYFLPPVLVTGATLAVGEPSNFSFERSPLSFQFNYILAFRAYLAERRICPRASAYEKFKSALDGKLVASGFRLAKVFITRKKSLVNPDLSAAQG